LHSIGTGGGTAGCVDRSSIMSDKGEVVAVALLTQGELIGIGQALRFVVPIEKVPDDLSALLAKIDDADLSKSKK
jgi:hypothetical protein